MRLTLRTMLAYLDDILEPDDTEDIGKKIEQSEFATNLVHRARDCMRRLRLGVPALLGRGLAADPNTVAEYLDNTLSTERVPEFEKICLESDVHLAEVASCHQILTLVLGEPAEIEPASRQRMYQLAAHVDAPPMQTDSIRPAGVAAASPPRMQPIPVRRARPEVPEYLRESRSRFWPAVAVLLVAAVLTFGGLFVFSQRRGDGTLADAENGTKSADPSSQPAGASSEEEFAKTEEQDSSAAELGETKQPDESLAKASSPKVIPDPTGVPEDADAPPAPQPGDEPAALGANDIPAPLPTALGKVADGAIPPPSIPTVPPSDTDQPADRDAAAAEPVGHYMSASEVLLKLDPDTATWKRLRPHSPLSKGDRLLSLPSFRPVLALSSGISVQPDGAASFELLGFTNQGVPIIGIEFGRFLVRTLGKPGNSLELRIGEHQPLLTFVDAESTLALEIRRVLPPGADPLAGPAPLIVDLYATSGVVRLREEGPPIDLQAPARRALFVANAEPTDAEFPKWVTSEALSEVERSATAAVELELANDKPIDLSLKELAESKRPGGRRIENRLLAMRSAGYLGEFDAAVKCLNDVHEKASWRPCIEELRAAVARSPDTAKQVRAAFEKQRGGDAASLFRMLWGYSADDLAKGADKDLVEALNNDSLDYRLLGFWNLQNIAGPATYAYRPEEQRADKRRVAFNAWKEKVNKGKLVPKAAPAPKPKAAGAKTN